MRGWLRYAVGAAIFVSSSGYAEDVTPPKSPKELVQFNLDGLSCANSSGQRTTAAAALAAQGKAVIPQVIAYIEAENDFSKRSAAKPREELRAMSMEALQSLRGAIECSDSNATFAIGAVGRMARTPSDRMAAVRALKGLLKHARMQSTVCEELRQIKPPTVVPAVCKGK